MDNDRNIVSSTDAQYNGIYEQDIRNMLSSETRKGNFETARQEPMMVSYDTLDVNGWKIINMVPESFVTQQVSEVNSIILSVILISILIFVILTVSMIFLITRPIKQFTGVMKKVGDGDLSIRFRPAANDEIGLMAHTFDQMLDNINSLMEEVKTERDGKIFAELKTLQQQINSHFLYNTLDSIYWMSKSGNGDDAAEMIASLAQFIRLGLNNGEDMTTVAKEIEHVRNYMTIQKYRYDGKLNYRIDADKNAMDCVVPKLLLQPLVENSILHGIVKLSRPGHIDIRVQKRDNRVIFEVEDDGVGLDAEKIKARIASGKAADNGDTKGGYALYNIYNRLKMIYKDAARIEFYGRPGAGSKVTITLPA